MIRRLLWLGTSLRKIRSNQIPLDHQQLLPPSHLVVQVHLQLLMVPIITLTQAVTLRITMLSHTVMVNHTDQDSMDTDHLWALAMGHPQVNHRAHHQARVQIKVRDPIPLVMDINNILQGVLPIIMDQVDHQAPQLQAMAQHPVPALACKCRAKTGQLRHQTRGTTQTTTTQINILLTDLYIARPRFFYISISVYIIRLFE